jgi:branched-chain amino acid aminotransferase
VNTADQIWLNGEFVAWEDAKVHVLTHAMHYGTGVFEGIRAYETDRGTAIFRHREHLERLEASAKLYYMDLPYTREQIREATHELIARNGFSSCYVRPLVWRGYGPMGLNPLDNPVEAMVAVWEWGAYLGEEGKRNGVRGRVSSYRRISSDSLIPHAKACGQYLNSVLAKIESLKAGYEEAILLDDKGYVCEGSGENIFVVKDGVIHTPPVSAGALEGITQDSVRTMARDLDIEYRESNLVRTDLYTAEEAFLSGTAAEIVPIRSVDDREIGDPGPVTRRIQEVFHDAVRGKVDQYKDWNEHVG